MAKTLRGTKVWVPTLAGLGVRCGRVAPSRCEGAGVSLSENFLKTQMLNPAFW